jgi:Uma2 family endonuclease
MTATARTIPTEPDVFIAWENRQKARYELIDGVVRMMTGGTAAHDLIAINIGAALRVRLTRRGCAVHGSNLKLRSPDGSVMYPDCFVRCGPFVDEVTEIDDPMLVVEVLWPRTKRYGMLAKRQAYLAIPSLRRILFVSPDACRVELETRRDDGTWLLSLPQRLDDEVPLEALGVSLPLAEIYVGTRVASEAGAAGG